MLFELVKTIRLVWTFFFIVHDNFGHEVSGLIVQGICYFAANSPQTKAVLEYKSIRFCDNETLPKPTATKLSFQEFLDEEKILSIRIVRSSYDIERLWLEEDGNPSSSSSNLEWVEGTDVTFNINPSKYPCERRDREVSSRALTIDCYGLHYPDCDGGNNGTYTACTTTPNVLTKQPVFSTSSSDTAFSLRTEIRSTLLTTNNPNNSRGTTTTTTMPTTAALSVTATTKPHFKQLTLTNIQKKEIRLSLELLKNLTETDNPGNQTTPHKLCPCACGKRFDPNPSPAVLAKILAKIRRELWIHKANLSSAKNKKISAKDHRPTSQTIGATAVLFAAMPFLFIVSLDLARLLQYFHQRHGTVQS